MTSSPAGSPGRRHRRSRPGLPTRPGTATRRPAGRRGHAAHPRGAARGQRNGGAAGDDRRRRLRRARRPGHRGRRRGRRLRRVTRPQPGRAGRVPGLRAPRRARRRDRHGDPRGPRPGCLDGQVLPRRAGRRVAALSAFAGPFPDVRFVPTGGLNPGNAPAYLALPSVLAVGGSWMVPRKAIANDDLDSITRLTAEAAAALATGVNR